MKGLYFIFNYQSLTAGQHSGGINGFCNISVPTKMMISLIKHAFDSVLKNDLLVSIAPYLSSFISDYAWPYTDLRHQPYVSAPKHWCESTFTIVKRLPALMFLPSTIGIRRQTIVREPVNPIKSAQTLLFLPSTILIRLLAPMRQPSTIVKRLPAMVFLPSTIGIRRQTLVREHFYHEVEASHSAVSTRNYTGEHGLFFAATVAIPPISHISRPLIHFI